MGLGYLFLSLVLRNLHITPITPPCMVKMLLHWYWFTSTTWHAHNCEWTVSHRILDISWWNPVVGVSTDDLRKGLQLVGWILGLWWPPSPYFFNLCVCKFVCLLVCYIVCLLCFYVVILNVFVFLICSMLNGKSRLLFIL